MEQEANTWKIAAAGFLDTLNRFAGQIGAERFDAGKFLDVDERVRLVTEAAHHLSAGEQPISAGFAGSAKSPLQLLKIFCDLTPKERISGKPEEIHPPADVYWPLAELKLDEAVLFANEAEDPAALVKVQNLWAKFSAELRQLLALHTSEPQSNDAVLLENLLLLSSRFTWCLPAGSYSGRANTSLYDHARMTAALAVILATGGLNHNELRDVSAAPQKAQSDVAVLVGGDLSGVQEFLYTITDRGATSALRGRSFYLQLLTEAIARYTLRRLNLPITSLIYAGGGNFYLFARPQDAAEIGKIQAEVSRALLVHHQGSLYLAVRSIPLRPADFFEGRLGSRWGELIAGLQQAKLRRFSELEAAELQRFFKPQGHGGNQEAQCQVCGTEHPAAKPDQKTASSDESQGVRKCPACRSYEDLGDRLRKAQYLVYTFPLAGAPAFQYAAQNPGRWEEVLALFGLAVEPVDELGKLPQASGPALVLALNDAALNGLQPGPRRAVGRRLLVNVTPLLTQNEVDHYSKGRDPAQRLESGRIKPFDVMEDQAEGIKRLGVLRMDVDNMGGLFSTGLGAKATLARIASLSSTISLFFEGWVGVLADGFESLALDGKLRGELLYSIYSGGDDLFFVGAWDVVIELARRIRIDLGRFTASHLGIHASAGVALVGGKYPLAQAARDAGRYEEAAKDHQWWNDADRTWRLKDAVTFLGQTLPWTRFGLGECSQPGLSDAHALMHWLLTLKQTKKRDPTPLVRRLSGLSLRYRESLDERRRKGLDQNKNGRPQALFGPWNWLSFYSLSRVAEQTRDNDVRNLRDELKASDFNSIDWIGLAARWVELMNR